MNETPVGAVGGDRDGARAVSSTPGGDPEARELFVSLAKAMRAYQKGARKSKAMAAMLDGLSAAEIESLAAHYASQRARSVIYVLLPPK